MPGMLGTTRPPVRQPGPALSHWPQQAGLAAGLLPGRALPGRQFRRHRHHGPANRSDGFGYAQHRVGVDATPARSTGIERAPCPAHLSHGHVVAQRLLSWARPRRRWNAECWVALVVGTLCVVLVTSLGSHVRHSDAQRHHASHRHLLQPHHAQPTWHEQQHQDQDQDQHEQQPQHHQHQHRNQHQHQHDHEQQQYHQPHAHPISKFHSSHKIDPARSSASPSSARGGAWSNPERSRILSVPAASNPGHGGSDAMQSDAQKPSSSSSSSPAGQVDAWLRRRTLRQVMPAEELKHTLSELRRDAAFKRSGQVSWSMTVRMLETQMRQEDRSIRAIIGDTASEQFIVVLESLDADADTTRSLLRTPVVEQLIGSLLYEGIFEFVQTVDLLGNIVNTLPVIGPFRQQLVSGFKQELDRTLGRQIKSFMGSYSRLATDRLIDMVLSEESSEGFRNARRQLGEHILSRPLSSLVPPHPVVKDWRDSVWNAISLGTDDETALAAVDTAIDKIYSAMGDMTLNSLGISTPTSALGLADDVLARFLASEEGRSFTDLSLQKQQQ